MQHNKFLQKLKHFCFWGNMVNITNKAFLEITNLRNIASQAASTHFADFMLLIFSYYKLMKLIASYFIYDFNNRRFINFIFNIHRVNQWYCLGLN